MISHFILMVSSIALTAICWGVYNPIVQWGQNGMGGGRLRPFVCVGLAYFLIAVVLPMLLISIAGQESDAKFEWKFTGTFWSLMGGTVGALGAFGIIMALSYGGKPLFVAPLVFGFAPVVNTLFTMYFAPPKEHPHPMFYAGMILVVAGAVTVLLFRPGHGPAPDKSHGEKSAAKTDISAAKA
ncbi:MAG TPA: hypothetical protein VL096_05250 [Pirellulaceae bacterium]|nr:hypothetical protein [Pirellulaceae bacterium]